MRWMNATVMPAVLVALGVGATGCRRSPVPTALAEESAGSGGNDHENAPRDNAERMIRDGRRIFRFDTFGDEAFWGDTLQLHEAIEGAANGGVGPGVSPTRASTARKGTLTVR